MRILVLSNVAPLPPNSGIRLRLAHLLRRVAARHQVTVACHAWDEAEDAAARGLEREGIRVVTGRIARRPWGPRARAVVAAALGGRPPELALWRSDALATALRATVAAERFDVVQMEESILAGYDDCLPPRAAAKRVLVLHNVRFDQLRRIAAVTPQPALRAWMRLNAGWMRGFEPRFAATFDRTITVSEPDRGLLLAADPTLAVRVVPNGVDTRSLRPLPPPAGPPAVLFVGHMGYAPCVDAAERLVRGVLPLLRRERPDVEAWIVGQEPAARVRALAGPGVHVTGEVPDVTPYYARASVVVVPLRAGGGTRLKILEAMALGRPVVSTPLGAEGLDLEDGRHLRLGALDAPFAAAILGLLGDADARARIAACARRRVEERHDWDAVAARQLAVYEELFAGADGAMCSTRST